MTIFTETHARLADDVYLHKPRGSESDIPPFEVYRVITKPSGYHGVIYRNKETGELVVSHRGTEFDGDKLRDLVTTDGQMALSTLNQQLDGAREAVELAMALARKEGVSVTVTGHSLGGALAQITAAEFNLRGETFNAYGAAGLHGTPAGGDQIVNHVRATDMVSAAGRHFGNVRVYATELDQKLLLRDGSPPDTQTMPQFLADVAEFSPGKTHGMVQFYGGDRSPNEIGLYGVNSLIDPANEARYETHKRQYDAYRGDIRETALATRHGLPLATGLPGAQLAVGLTYPSRRQLSDP